MTRRIIFTVIAVLLAAALACTGTVQNLRVDGLPQYVCPSSTPRPTHTALPTSPPTWPPYFAANLNWYQVAPNFNTVTVQWTGQSAGTVYLWFSGTMNVYPYYWPGTGGYIAIDSIPGPAVTRSYPVAIPTSVTTASISMYASSVPNSVRSFTVTRVYTPITPSLIPPPGGAPGPVFPTPRPTYTPWPTPTQYVRTNDYFVGDAIYTPVQPSGLRLRFRVMEIRDMPAAAPDGQGQPQSVVTWTLEVKNVGSVEYDLFPAGQMYVSTVTLPTGYDVDGVWGASIAAAEEAGFPPNYELADIQPGETKTFTLAAYTPRGTPRRISYVLDVTARAEGLPTVVPGQNVVSWINEVNTICTGEIEEP
ncbi:MAG: hypothetical protein JXN59_02815 [Anaerolineae bacterium]|nr:hypothetical protein [Anaerolineae bacterium]